MRLPRSLAAPAAVAAFAFLPFVHGAVLGRSFFFRDLSRQFFPVREFVLDGLRQGEVRYWNPLVHEGEPLPLPPLGYPLDLLQLLRPDEWGISLLLAAHVSLAAVTFLLLARGLGLTEVAAAGAGIVYALGGLSLSSLHLYVHLEGLAWAPLVVLALLRAGNGSPRAWVLGALATAVAISTTGIEFVAQAALLGLVLAGLRAPLREWGARALVLVLGAGLAGAVILPASALVGGTARAGGFTPAMVLGFSLHPVWLLQVVVAGLFADVARYRDTFWGQRFTDGFPYFLSLYLGPAVLALALAGIRLGGRPAKRIALLALLAVVISLGRFGGLGPVVEAFPALRSLRFPSKVFFTVHMAAALLAGFGLDAARRRTPAWRPVALSALVLGLALGGVIALPWLWRGGTIRFLSGFFPDRYPWPLRVAALGSILWSATAGALGALAVAALGGLALRRRVAPLLAAVGAVAVLGADLLRAGAGLNPMVTPAFFELSPEMAPVASTLAARGRLFTCEPSFSRGFGLAERGKQNLDAWLLKTYAETLTPYLNMRAGVRSAYGRDLTGLTPTGHSLGPAELGCADFPALAPRLRRAGVSDVLSIVPLPDPTLEEWATLRPAGVSPLILHLYALEDPLSLRSVARRVEPVATASEGAAVASRPGFQAAGGVAIEGYPEEVSGAAGRILSSRERADRLDLDVQADRATALVVRDTWAPGWRATVNGEAAPVLRADGRHRAVPIPAGRSRVRMAYHPPRLVAGLLVSLLSALVAIGIWCWRPPRPSAA